MSIAWLIEFANSSPKPNADASPLEIASPIFSERVLNAAGSNSIKVASLASSAPLTPLSFIASTPFPMADLIPDKLSFAAPSKFLNAPRATNPSISCCNSCKEVALKSSPVVDSARAFSASS